MITVNQHTDEPPIEGKIPQRTAKVFLDTGAMVNMISLNVLNNIKPGVNIIEATLTTYKE